MAVNSAEPNLWPDRSRIWSKQWWEAQYLAKCMQWSTYTFLLIFTCSQDLILEHQILLGINWIFAPLCTSGTVIAQTPSFSDVSAAKIPPNPEVSDDGGRIL